MASRPQKPEPRPAPRLALVTPPVTGAELVPALKRAMAAGDVAAVLLQLADADERTLINSIKELAPAVQNNGAALLLVSHPDLVARSNADGAHLSGFDEFDAALETLKPDRIAGAGALASRDDAMTAAEAGADYISFGWPRPDGSRQPFEAIEERVAWWAEVFTVPCMAYVVSIDEIGPLVSAGADFVALAPDLWAQAPAETVAAASARLALPEAVT